MTRPLRIALPKGRMMEQSLELWGRIGAEVASDVTSSRRLILPSADGRFEFLPVKNGDVPTYVEAGVADAGVVGLDVLYEVDADVLRPLDLGFGPCRLAVAAPSGTPYPLPRRRSHAAGGDQVRAHGPPLLRRAGGPGGACADLRLRGDRAAARPLALDPGPGADAAALSRRTASWWWIRHSPPPRG